MSVLLSLCEAVCLCCCLCVRLYVCVAAENRAVLRDVNIVKHIVMFLAEQKYQELHVFAIMLLANCVEDADIVKVILHFYHFSFFFPSPPVDSI